MSGTGYKRVYEKHGAFHFVDKAGKWHRLCRVDDGEPAMLRALAKVRDKPQERPGSMPALTAAFRKSNAFLAYSDDVRYDYGLMLDKIDAALRDHDVAEIDSSHVLDLRDQWLEKPRSANKYHALLSVLMGFAILQRQRTTNPCLEVKKLEVKRRRRYLTHAELRLVLMGLCISNDHRPNPSGPMMACLVLFAYLTGLRMKDVRELKWSQVSDQFITVQPTKTRESTATTLEIVLTPDISEILGRVRRMGTVKALTVFHGLKGNPYTKDGIETAWQRACARQEVTAAIFRDLRAKALSDAKRNGLALSLIQDGAGHSSVTTTEQYLRGFEVKRVNLALTLPKVSKSGG